MIGFIQLQNDNELFVERVVEDNLINGLENEDSFVCICLRNCLEIFLDSEIDENIF